MPLKEHGVNAEAANEARLAKGGPSVLALLTIPSEAHVKRCLHQQKLKRYRQRLAESNLALTRQQNRHNDLLRQLADEEAKDQIELPLG
jgi:hypothetical protein